MRKTLLLTLCVGFCLLLAACGAEQVKPSPTPAATPSPAPTEDPALSNAWDPERWMETDPVFDPAPADIPENWICRQAIYEVWEDGSQYGQFVWLDENGTRCRVANYIGDFCSYQKDYDEKGRPVRSVGYDHKTGLVSERTKYVYSDADAQHYDRMVQTRYDEQGRVTQTVTQETLQGFSREESLKFAYDENGGMRQEKEVLILSDGETAWYRTRDWENAQRTVTFYSMNGVDSRVCTQVTDGNLTRTEMRDADGNLLYSQELSHTEDGTTAKTVKETTVPDSDMVIRWELSVGEDGSGTSSIQLNGKDLRELGAEAHIFHDDLTGEERWLIFRDGETWLEIFWKPDPLEKDGWFPYEVICRYWEPVTVAEGVEWTEGWQARIPLTDGELTFKDYAAVWAQLSESERKSPWSEIPYETEGLGFIYKGSLFDDPEAALNVHPEGWCVPAGGAWTLNVSPAGLVRCTGLTEQQTDVQPGDILVPWELLRDFWYCRDEESGLSRSVTVSVKPGAFDYDPDPNRDAGNSYDVRRYDLNDPGTAAHVFVGDMDSRIGRAKLAIRTEDGRCHVSMVLDETGYWVDTFGLTQEEVTALLLSIVNSAPESSVRGWIQEYLRETAESGECWLGK